MCSGGTVFVDHVSGVIKMYHQVSLGASNTIRSKDIYEIWESEYGVSVQRYRGDKGACKSELFKYDLKKL